MTRTSNQLMGYARLRTRRVQELYDLESRAELLVQPRDQDDKPESQSRSRADRT